MDATTETIIIGAGLGRSGTTGLAVNLQRQDFAVSHEAGNGHSIDYRRTMKDHFSLAEQDEAARKKHASAIVADIVAAGRGESVVGDISWVHTQLAEELLQADKRVQVVFLYRKDVAAWVKSVLLHAPKPGLPETIVLRGADIDARKGDRGQRLKLYRRFVITKAKSLARRYKDRIHIVATEDLTKWGRMFVKRLGGKAGYDANAGKNTGSITSGR